MRLYDTESGVEQAAIDVRPETGSLRDARDDGKTISRWTDHAKQWLKGGALVLGTMALGSMTYLASSAFRRGVNETGTDTENSNAKPFADDAAQGVVMADSVGKHVDTATQAIGTRHLTESVIARSEATPVRVRSRTGGRQSSAQSPSFPRKLKSSAVVTSGPSFPRKRESSAFLDPRLPRAPRSSRGVTDRGARDDASQIARSISPSDLELEYPAQPTSESSGSKQRRIVPLGEFRVNTYTAGGQVDASVAALTDGGFVVTWQSYGQDGDNFGIYGQRYDASGAKVSSEFRVNTYTIGTQRLPRVASLADGSFVVVWASNDGSGDGIYGQRYNTNGAPLGSEFPVNTIIGCTQAHPQVTGLISGGFVVAWLSDCQDGSGYGVYGRRYDANGIPQGDDFKVNTYTTSDQYFLSTAGLTGGGFVVVWQSAGQDGSGWGIFGRRYDASGVAQDDEFQVNIFTTDTQDIPCVAGLTGGGFVVSWVSFDNSEVGVYCRRYASNGIPQSEEVRVNTNTTSYQLNVHVTDLANGGYLITWSSFGQDGSSYGIYGQRYDAGGIAQSTEFKINTYTTNSQDFSSSTKLLDNNFVVVWQSNGQDGDLNGVYAQIFQPNVAPVLDDAVNPVLTTISEDTLSPAGNTVAEIIVDGSITDADIDVPVVEAMAITAVDNINGIWQYSLDGTSWNPIAPVDDTNSLLLDSAHKVRFIPNSDFFGNATFTFRAWDKYLGTAGTKVDTSTNGGGTPYSIATDTASITVTNVNDAPVLNAASTPTLTDVAEDTLLPAGNTVAEIVADGSITDVDGAAIEAMAVTAVDNAYGTWQYSLNGVFWSPIAPVSENSALLLDSINKIRFVPSLDYNGPSQFQFRAWDKTSGTVGFKVDTTANGGTTAFSVVIDNATIDVTAVNDAPVLNPAASPVLPTIAEDTLLPSGDIVSNIIVDGSITETAPDEIAVEAIAITAINNTNGNWEYSLDNVIWNAITPVDSANSLLLDSSHYLRFVPNADFYGESTFTFRAWDKSSGTAGNKVSTTVNGGTTAFSSASDTASITVTNINDAPVLNPAASPELSTVVKNTANPQGDAVSTIVVNNSITDADGVAIEAMAITDVDNTNGAWQYSVDGTNWNPIAPVSESSSLLLNSAHKVRFISNLDYTGNATFTFRAWDTSVGTAGTKVDSSPTGGTTAFSTDTDTASITIIAVNNAPVLNPAATPLLTSINEDTTLPNGNTCENIIVDGSITDPDGAAVKAMAITAADNTNGVWQYSLDGATWNDVAPVSGTNSLLLDSAHKLRFIPTPDWNGNATMTFRAWDKTSETAGTKVDTTTNGGGTPFSSATDTAIITITAVNDAPILNASATPALTAIAEDTLSPSGNTVANIIGDGSITDADGTAVAAMAITSVDDTNGIWQYSTNSGSSWSDIATVSNTESLLLDSNNKIRFIPNTDYNGNASFTFRAWDKSTGTIGTKGDTTTNGNTTPFSTNTNTASITVTAVNDAPQLSTTVGAASYTENSTPTIIDPAITINDVDSATLTGATVSITGGFVAAEDKLIFTNQNGIVGNYNSGTGVLTLTGTTTIANYQTALQSIGYQNSSENPNTTPRTLSFIVNDGISNSLAATRGLNIIAANDIPVLINNALTIEQGKLTIITSGMLSADDLDNDPATLTFEISEIKNGQFELVSNPGTGITSFTQAQITSGSVQFKHDDSNKAPSYKVAVSDGNYTTESAAAIINFVPEKAADKVIGAADPATTVRNAIIGGSISGTLGLMFLILKIYLNRKAAHALEKSSAGYKGSAQESKEEYYRNVIQPIAKEIFKQVKITGPMGYISEQRMQEYVGEVLGIVGELERLGVEVEPNKLTVREQSQLHTEIARQTRAVVVPGRGCSGFFNAALSPDDLRKYATQIAQGVKGELKKVDLKKRKSTMVRSRELLEVSSSEMNSGVIAKL